MNNNNNILLKCYNILKHLIYIFDKINLYCIEKIDLYINKIICLICCNTILYFLFIPLIIFIKVLNIISLLIENNLILHHIPISNDIDNKEHMEWINSLLSKCWKEISIYLSIKARMKFENVFIHSKPVFLKSIDISTLNLGSIPIDILNISIVHDNLMDDNKYIHLVIDYEFNSNLEALLQIQDYFHINLSIYVNNLISKGTFHAILGLDFF